MKENTSFERETDENRCDDNKRYDSPTKHTPIKKKLREGKLLQDVFRNARKQKEDQENL